MKNTNIMKCMLASIPPPTVLAPGINNTSVSLYMGREITLNIVTVLYVLLQNL